MQVMIAFATVISGCLILYFALRRLVKTEYARVRRQVEAHAAALCASNEELRNEMGRLQAKLAGNMTVADAGLKPQAGNPVQSSQEIAPETLVAITEVLTCLFGKKVRVLSATPLPVFPGTGEHPIFWTHQGRMHIHASHEVVQRGF